MTRHALVAYSVGLLGLILVKVLAPGFYARQNIRTPVRIAIIALVATQAMNFALIGFLQHAGLALAIGLGACLNAGLLYYKLRQFDIYSPLPGWAMFALKIVLAIVAMSACLKLCGSPGCRVAVGDRTDQSAAPHGRGAVRRSDVFRGVVAARISARDFVQRRRLE